jgi:hypothetical protein
MQSEYVSGGVGADDCEEAVDGGYEGCCADVQNTNVRPDRKLVVLCGCLSKQLSRHCRTKDQSQSSVHSKNLRTYPSHSTLSLPARICVYTPSVVRLRIMARSGYKGSVNIERERRGLVTYPFRSRRPLVLKSLIPLNNNSSLSSLVHRLSHCLSLPNKSSSSTCSANIIVFYSSAL